jgi:enamine deaminase RidA (YjgF/YER057c/UK114 family)
MKSSNRSRWPFWFAVLLLAGLGAGSIRPGFGQAPAPAKIQRLNPETLARVPYLSQIVSVENGNRLVHIAGQTAINKEFKVVGNTLAAQIPEALANLGHALDAAGAKRQDVLKLTIMFVDSEGKAPDLLTRSVREFFAGGPLPAMTYVGVPSLVGPGMLVEVEGLAAVN